MPEMTLQQAIDLAHQHRRAGQLAQAELIFRQIIAYDPQRHDIIQQVAQLAHQSGQIEESLELMRRAVVLAPGVADYHANLAMLLSTLGRFDEAIPEYRQAMVLEPNLPDVFNNLGNLLRETGQPAEAESFFRKAMALQPSEVARWNLSFMLLARGEFAEGWPAYESRLSMNGFPARKFPQPMWDGRDLGGRTILLHAEQGMGDTFNFIRYAPLVHQRGGRVIMLCQPPVHRLLATQTQLGVDQWISEIQPLPPFDVHCPLLSLPGIFGTTFESIPNTVPYLFPDPALANRWRDRIAQLPGLKVGLVWKGSPTPIHNRKRSTTLAELAPLFAVPGVSFISLQKGEPPVQANTFPAGATLIDSTSDLADFADTAALISTLDLVISIDTGVAHLSGALGKPTWVLLPFVPDWRWFHDRSDSPWYPTMRLFRQSHLSDWSQPIRAASVELSCLAGTPQ
jgi:hypothetical protein